MNVLIIDDHQIMSDGIMNRVKKVLPKAHCVFVDNVRSAYAELHHQHFDLIISDLEFDDEPEHDGFFIARKILELDPRAKIIALTHYNSYRIMKKAKEAGFMSFLHKGTSFDDFSDTILQVLKNGEYVSETEKKLLKKRKAISRSIFNISLKGIASLSNRELELATLCAVSTDRNELAKKMKVEAYTIDSHFKHILAKLHLNSRKELAIFAKDFQQEILKEFNSRKKA